MYFSNSLTKYILETCSVIKLKKSIIHFTRMHLMLMSIDITKHKYNFIKFYFMI